MTPIEKHSKIEHAEAIAAYIPGGKLFAGKSIAGTVFRRFIEGLSCEFQNSELFLKTLQDEFLPDTTVLFIPEWEKMLGIPDDCFPGTGDLDERRLHIIVKLASLGVQTEQDFVDLALLFGVDAEVTPGIVSSGFPFTFPMLFFDTVKEARFTIVVTFTAVGASRFPFTFPILFGNESIAILECLFQKLKPANCQVIFKQV